MGYDGIAPSINGNINSGALGTLQGQAVAVLPQSYGEVYGTGIDLRSFDQIAFGMRYSYPSAGITKVNTVAVASGSSNTGAIVAAGRMIANGKYQEQKYQSKTIYIFTLDQQGKLFAPPPPG